MLMREMDCIKDLNHPNIVKWYDTHVTINNCYIIT
jgi:serine/threonine protein kinase